MARIRLCRVPTPRADTDARGSAMTIAALVAQYGYLAVFVGALLEGETVLLLAGAAAQRGLLSYPVVVLIAFFAGTLGDQILFAIGRRYGTALLRRYPGFEARAARIRELIRRHQNALVVGVRFMYGLRLIGPVAIGMSEVSARRFLVFNLIGAAIWAPLVVGVGFLFGEALDRVLAGLGRFEALALGVVALIVIGVALGRRRRRSGGSGGGA